MDGIKGLANAGIALSAFSLAAVLAISPISAQEAVTPGFAAQGAAISGAALPEALAGTPKTRPESGIALGSWMLYPSIFAGVIFNSNVYQTQLDPKGAIGSRITPNLEIDQDDGLHKTTVYANADAQLYPGAPSNHGLTASTISGRAGLAHFWEPMSDLSVHFSSDFTRMSGAFGSTFATGSPVNSATSFVGAPVAMNVANYRQFTDQTTTILTVEKKLTERTFIRTGLGVQQVIYEQPPIAVASSPSSIDYNAFGRFGFWVTPQLNAFVETGADLRRYGNASQSNSNSYRVVCGVASDLIGLFRGEVYGGAQKQYSTQRLFAATTAPTYGGRISYYPTPYLTVAASVDQGFGSAAATLGASPAASGATLQARLQVDYALFEYWRASARAGYADTRYTASTQMAESWIAGAGFSYDLWRNTAFTFDYQYTRTASNWGAFPNSDSLVSAGVTYRY
jgi:hypothetical protein